MVTAPFLCVYSLDRTGRDPETGEQIAPSEFFDLATALSFVLPDFLDQARGELKPLTDLFLGYVRSASGGGRLEKLFEWYCRACAMYATLDRQPTWQADPEAFHPAARRFLAAFFMYYARIDRAHGAGAILDLMCVFRTILDGYAETLEDFAMNFPGMPPPRPPRPADEDLPAFVSRFGLAVCIKAIELIDRLIPYLERADREGATYSFDPPPEVFADVTDFGDRRLRQGRDGTVYIEEDAGKSCLFVFTEPAPVAAVESDASPDDPPALEPDDDTYPPWLDGSKWN